MRNPAFCIGKNIGAVGADQLCGNHTADQRLSFHYVGSTILLLTKSKILSLKPSNVAVRSGLCPTWLETWKTGFLMMWLTCNMKALSVSDTQNIGVIIFTLKKLTFMLRKNEPRYEKTGLLHMRKQRRRSAVRCYRTADQRLCFRYIDTTIPPLSKSEISSL